MLKSISALFSVFSEFDLSSRPTVVAAVSGGSDSTAMLMLLQNHLHEEAPSTHLLAVTVDHGLRASSAEEANHVARLCAGHGITHRIMRWTDPKPPSGIPAAAREARYRLLAQAAREAGTDIVVTGHTAEDQAETVFMRKQRGDGLGLAGMAPATLYDGAVWLLRPLLSERRGLLRDYLGWRGISWSEDATNTDSRFERPRVRARLAASPKPKARPSLYSDPIWDDIFSDPDSSGQRPRARKTEMSALLGLARQTARSRIRLGSRAAALIAALARRAAPGLLHLDPSFVKHTDREAVLYALRVLLATAGGSEFLPPEGRVDTLFEELAEPPFRGTLSRALVASRRDGVWLARETRGLPGPQPVVDGMIWDGRYRLRTEKDAAELQIAARGSDNAGPTDPAGLPKSLIRAAAAARPVLCLPDGRPVPAGRELPISLVPVVAPYARFLSGFDIELVDAVSRLIDPPPLPNPPFAGHK